MDRYEVTILRDEKKERATFVYARSPGAAIAKVFKSYTRFTTENTLRFGAIKLGREQSLTVKITRM